MKVIGEYYMIQDSRISREESKQDGLDVIR